MIAHHPEATGDGVGHADPGCPHLHDERIARLADAQPAGVGEAERPQQGARIVVEAALVQARDGAGVERAEEDRSVGVGDHDTCTGAKIRPGRKMAESTIGRDCRAEFSAALGNRPHVRDRAVFR